VHIFINSHGCPHPMAMILFLQGRSLSNKMKYSTSKADITKPLEDANLNGLDDTTAATALMGAHSNMTGAHGRISIGVQAGVLSITSSGTCDLKPTDNEEETWGTGVSIGVDAGQQVGGKIGSAGFFEGGELVSIIIVKKYCALYLDLGSNITVTGGTFRTIYGDFYELPEEFKQSVKSCLLAEERFAD